MCMPAQLKFGDLTLIRAVKVQSDSIHPRFSGIRRLIAVEMELPVRSIVWIEFLVKRKVFALASSSEKRLIISLQKPIILSNLGGCNLTALCDEEIIFTASRTLFWPKCYHIESPDKFVCEIELKIKGLGQGAWIVRSSGQIVVSLRASGFGFQQGRIAVKVRPFKWGSYSETKRQAILLLVLYVALESEYNMGLHVG